jgi:hypothetical protein
MSFSNIFLCSSELLTLLHHPVKIFSVGKEVGHPGEKVPVLATQAQADFKEII